MTSKPPSTPATSAPAHVAAPKAAPKPVAKAPPAVPVPAKPVPPKPVEFPPEDVREPVERIVARYPTKMAALIPLLHLAQARFGGWISPEVEAGVAKYLGVSDAHVHGVVTFYAMFNTKPVGKSTVWVCRTLTCALLGASELTKTACRKAGVEGPGESSKDGRFFVREMECLGLCEVAPAVFVAGKAHGNVTPETLESLMEACPK